MCLNKEKNIHNIFKTFIWPNPGCYINVTLSVVFPTISSFCQFKIALKNSFFFPCLHALKQFQGYRKATTLLKGTRATSHTFPHRCQMDSGARAVCSFWKHYSSCQRSDNSDQGFLLIINWDFWHLLCKTNI